MSTPLWQEGTTRVDREWVRTALKDVRVSEIAAIEMGRPVAMAGVLAAGVVGVLAGLRPVLYAGEIVTALAVAALLVILSTRFGWMILKSEALKSDPTRIFGSWAHLQRLRAAIHAAQTPANSNGDRSCPL